MGGVCSAPVRGTCACTGWSVCTASGQCIAPAEADQFRVGACYHDTGAWKPGATAGSWDVTSASVFIPIYDKPGVRPLVQRQLAAMAQGGAAVVKTILWFGDEAAQPAYPSWMVAFPPTQQQLVNLHQFAVDVSTTLRPNGLPMELLLGGGFLAAADVSVGDVTRDKVGWDCLSTAEWSQRMAAAYTSVLDAVKDVFRGDGQPAVSLMYLWTEVQVCATDDDADPGCQWASAGPDACKVNPAFNRGMHNQQWFLKTFYPGFTAAARAAGIIPSIYFGGGNLESTVMDNAYQPDPFASQQPEFALLNQHRSMAFPFRGLWWMKQHGLELPARFDIDFYAPPVYTTPATLTARFLDDVEAVVPHFYPGQRLRYGIVEAAHPLDQTARAQLGKAFAAERLLRGGNPELVLFWSTPGPSADANPAPGQFDFDSYSTAGIVFPFLGSRGGFETSSNGSLPDGWTTLTGGVANMGWNTGGAHSGAADLRFDAARCASGCAAVESDAVAVQPGQAIAFHLWQKNGLPLPAGAPGPADPAFPGMSFALVGGDGAPFLQLGAVGNGTTYSSSPPEAWSRYAGVAVVPTGVTAARLQIRMQGTPAATAMEVDDVK